MKILQVIEKYLDYAIFYDYTFVVVKYTAQQILGSLQESDLGKKFLASSTMRDLCAAFGREADLDKRQAWIKSRSEELGFGLLSSSEVSMRQGTMSDKDVVIRTVKQVREMKGAEEDKALLKELAADGAEDDTLVCEVNRRFVRGHYANDTNLPKARCVSVEIVLP